MPYNKSFIDQASSVKVGLVNNAYLMTLTWHMKPLRILRKFGAVLLSTFLVMFCRNVHPFTKISV